MDESTAHKKPSSDDAVSDTAKTHVTAEFILDYLETIAHQPILSERHKLRVGLLLEELRKRKQ